MNSILRIDRYKPYPRSYVILEAPQHGRIILHDEAVGYLPDPGYIGTDKFVIKFGWVPAFASSFFFTVKID